LFIGFVAVAAVFALLGNTGGGLVVLAALGASIGVISRLEFAARRRDLQSQRKDIRDTRRMMEQIARRGAADAKRPLQPVIDLAPLRSEIRGMRVAQQLMSQTITATKSDVLASAEMIAELEYRAKVIDDSLRTLRTDLAEGASQPAEETERQGTGVGRRSAS
jgi:hypothetical protein